MKSVEERMKEMVAAFKPCDVSEVTPEKRFVEDFGFTSLDSIEFCMDIEDEWGLEVTDEDFAKVLTVQDAVDYVVKRTEGAA
jgi:acyl carrier protein